MANCGNVRSVTPKRITGAAAPRPGGRDDWDLFFFTSIIIFNKNELFIHLFLYYYLLCCASYCACVNINMNNSERSEVPTRVLVTLAWFPEFRKSRSRPLEHHRPAFAVYQLLIRLLTCYRVSQSRAMLRLAQVYVPHLKNCAPPLKLALHCHSSDPNFITTHTLTDNRPTL